MAEPARVLVSASAESVLGEYNHKIEIGSEDEFVIVYGPNGVGKTKFLEIIDALSRLRGYTLARLPFEAAVLCYSDGSKLQAERTPVSLSIEKVSDPTITDVSFSLTRPGKKKVSWKYSEDSKFVDHVRRRSPYQQISDELWEDPSDGEVIHVDELRLRYGRDPRLAHSQIADTPGAAREFAESVPSFLIETQRLRIEQLRPRPDRQRFPSPREPQRQRSRIMEQAANLKSLLNDAQTEHSRITQRLDRTFPNRVLGAAARDQHLDANSIRDRYNTQNEFRSRLARVASVSLDSELSLPEGRLDSWALTLLNQYLDDAEQKLAPFEMLLKKIELLEQIVNERLLNKSLHVTDVEGISVRHRTYDREIALDSLSSGEQHEIILMIDLLFNVPPGAVVLIDEPEISLHVAWQVDFMPDVQKIAALAGFRFIVATHSPQIINDRWDRAIRLGPTEVSFD